MFLTASFQELHLLGGSNDSDSLIFDASLSTHKETIENQQQQAYTAQCAIATGIGAAVLSRVVAHLFVYRTKIYKEAANKYHDTINRQQELIK